MSTSSVQRSNVSPITFSGNTSAPKILDATDATFARLSAADPSVAIVAEVPT